MFCICFQREQSFFSSFHEYSQKIGFHIKFSACFAIYDIFLPNFEKMLNCNLLSHEILMPVIGILTR